jgi:hypothetical protein
MTLYSWVYHPNNVCMSYFEHMWLSLGFSMTFLKGSMKALVHAFLPNMYITSTSDINIEISNKLKNSGCIKEH